MLGIDCAGLESRHLAPARGLRVAQTSAAQRTSLAVDIALAEAGRDGEVCQVGSIGGDLAGLDKALRKLISRGAPLHIVYEAEPCGLGFMYFPF
jgi:hypothetical protein